MKPKYTQHLLLIFLLFLSCDKNKLAERVSVSIQNTTSSEIIAVRLSNSEWKIINPGDVESFSNYLPFASTKLLAFTKNQSSSAFGSLKACIECRKANYMNPDYFCGKCNDDKINPPYSVLESFDFDSNRPEHSPQVLVHAVEIPDSLRTASNELEVRDIESIKFVVIH